MLLISRSLDLSKSCVSSFFDLQSSPVALNIFFCFSNHRGAMFFFSLLLSLSSSVLQWHHDERKLTLTSVETQEIRIIVHFQFCRAKVWSNNILEWPVKLTFIRRVLFINVLFSPIRSRSSSLVTFSNYLSSPFSSSSTFQSSPNTSAQIFLMSRCLSLTVQCSKHN